MYWEVSSWISIVVSIILCYLFYYVVSKLVLSWKKRIYPHFISWNFVKLKWIQFGNLFSDWLLGLAVSVSYGLILQIQFYTQWTYAPIIILFLFASWANLLTNVSMFGNWLGLVFWFYLLNPAPAPSYLVLLASSCVALVSGYALKWKLKNYLFFGVLNSFSCLIGILVFYFIFYYYQQDYFDWLANIFVSYFALMFLNYLIKKPQLYWIKNTYLVYANDYSHQIFINQTKALSATEKFLSTHQVNLAAYLTFDIQYINKDKQDFYAEKYVITLVKMMLKDYAKLFSISPHFCYSVLVNLSGTSSKKVQIDQFAKRLKFIEHYINNCLIHTNKNCRLRMYCVYYGWDFYDWRALIYVGELGIYNGDYSDQQYCKFYDQKQLGTDLNLAIQKKQLVQWLSQFNYAINLELVDQVYQPNMIALRQLLFDVQSIYQQVPEKLRTIFLQWLAYQAIVKYQSLTNAQGLLLIYYPLQLLVHDSPHLTKVLDKITQLNLVHHQLKWQLVDVTNQGGSNEIQTQYLVTKNHLEAHGFVVSDHLISLPA